MNRHQVIKFAVYILLVIQEVQLSLSFTVLPHSGVAKRINCESKCINLNGGGKKLSSTRSAVEAPNLLERDAKIASLLEKAKEAGQVGSKCTPEVRQGLVDMARELKDFSDALPARRPLTGIHNLIHSQSEGGSAGTLGPFLVGKVTQEFVNDKDFINGVSFLGGFFKISIFAERTILDDERLRVKFRETAVYLGGVEVIRKEIKGQGVWKNLFVGEYKNQEGESILLRVMEVPSLFVIEQEI